MHLNQLRVTALIIAAVQLAGQSHAANYQGGYKTDTSSAFSNESNPSAPGGYLVMDLGPDRQPLAVNNRGTVLLQRPNTSFNFFYRRKTTNLELGVEELLVGTASQPRSVARGLNNNDEIWGHVRATTGFLPQAAYWPGSGTTPQLWFDPNSLPAGWNFQSTDPYFFSDNRRFWVDRELSSSSSFRASIFSSIIPGEQDELFSDFVQPPYDQGDDMSVNFVAQSGDMLGFYLRRDGTLAYYFVGRHPLKSFSPAFAPRSGSKINSRGLALLHKYEAVSGAVGPLYLWDLARPDTYRLIGTARSPIPPPGQARAYLGLSTPQDDHDPLIIINDMEVLIENVEDGSPELSLHRYTAQSLLPTGSSWHNFRAVNVSDNARYIVGHADDAVNIRHAILLTRLDGLGLAVDANRDGTIKLASEDASDATSSASPYRFWLNDDIDRGHTVDGNDFEQDDIGPDEAAKPANNWKPDCDDDIINSERDLEDFSRLWISVKGLASAIRPSLTGPVPTFFVGLKWTGVPAGAPEPAIRLFSRVADDGSFDYLADPAKGAEMAFAPRVVDARHYDPSQPAAVVSPEFSVVGGTETFIIPSEKFANLTETNATVPFIFEACKPGKGQLKVVLLKKDGEAYTEIGEGPGVWMDLKMIGDMYEHWSVGNANGGDPDPAGAVRISSFTGSPAVFKYDNGSPSPEERKYVLFVHGWNLERWEKERYAETAYKRLWWQGYKGRFGLFSWPTTYGFNADFIDAMRDSTNYDRGEWAAWKSATPLRALLQTLHGPGAYGDQVYVVAHSMGNVLTGEALRLASQQGSGRLVNTYVASQAALPVHVYDGSSTNLLEALVPHVGNTNASTLDEFPETANVYPDWLAGNGAAAGTRVNFYNVNDYALWRDAWQFDQHLKPDGPDLPEQPRFYVYVDDPTQAPTANGFGYLKTAQTNPSDRFVYVREVNRNNWVGVLGLGSAGDPQDRYEIMAFAAESRSIALGANPGAATLTRSVDLTLPDNAIWPADTENPLRPFSAHKWHSGQFRSTNMRQKGYWRALLGSQGFNLGTTP